MISGKNQIIRQKKIDCRINMPTMSITKPDCQFGDSLTYSDNSGNSSPQLNDSLDTDFQYLNALDLSDSQGSDQTKLPSNEQQNKTLLDKNQALSPVENSKNSSLNSKTIASMLNNGGKLQISNALRARLRRSKSPNPKKPLLSINSMPSADQQIKNSRLANFSNRLSTQGFFSRSCQEEQLTNSLHKNQSEHEKNKSGHSSTSNSSLSLNTAKVRSFLAFTRAGQKSNSPSPKKSVSKGSIGHTSISIDENDSFSSSLSSPIASKQNSLSSYDVDLEKLARELILPSLNEPLTSFKLPDQSKTTVNADENCDNDNDNERNNNKSVLQSCKTIDNNESFRKQRITRSSTEYE